MIRGGSDTPSLFTLPGEQEELPLAVEEMTTDSEPSRDEEERSDEHLVDLAPVVHDLFTVWSDGSESAWVDHAWTALATRGLTTFDTEVHRALVVCRLAALSVLYRKFCSRAFEEGSGDSWRYHLHELLGEYPRVEPFTVGMLAERSEVGADIETGGEFHEGPPLAFAMHQLVSREYETVTRALRDEWGTAELVAGLLLSNRSATTYPLSDDDRDEALNRSVGGGAVDAWMWVDDGMELWG